MVKLSIELPGDVEVTWRADSPDVVMISRSPDPDDEDDFGTFQIVNRARLLDGLKELDTAIQRLS